jgi:HTH-type transcriptional regulator/antitoxin HigA
VRIRIIKTKAEYEAALARIEKLMDAAPHTAQGDELELLSLLVHVGFDSATAAAR